MKKIEINVSERDYEKLEKICRNKDMNIEELIREDLDNMINFYREQFTVAGLVF